MSYLKRLGPVFAALCLTACIPTINVGGSANTPATRQPHSKPGAANLLYLSFGDFNVAADWGINGPGTLDKFTVGDRQFIYNQVAAAFAQWDIDVVLTDSPVDHLGPRQMALHFGTEQQACTVTCNGVSHTGSFRRSITQPDVAQGFIWGFATHYDRYVAFRVAIHETGHLLGLDHTTADSIMNPSTYLSSPPQFTPAEQAGISAALG